MKRLIKRAGVIEVYHGTASDVVDAIKAEGIKPVVGGDGDGAYVSVDYEDARNYAVARAGEKRKYEDQVPQFAGVYPVVVVVRVDESELETGYNTNRFAPNGITSDKIVDVIDLSNDEYFQILLEAMDLERKGDSRANQLYQEYSKYTFKYV